MRLSLCSCLLLALASFSGCVGVSSRAPGQSTFTMVVIRGEITANAVQRLEATTQERIQGAPGQPVIFQLETGGGSIEACLTLSRRIRKLSADGVRTVAYVPAGAHALAGTAMIALACDALYMAEGCTLGSLQPTMFSADRLAPITSKKVLDVVVAALVEVGDRPDRSELLLRAMVDPDHEIPELCSTGETLVVSARDALHLRLIDGIASSLAQLEALIRRR